MIICVFISSVLTTFRLYVCVCVSFLKSINILQFDRQIITEVSFH